MDCKTEEMDSKTEWLEIETNDVSFQNICRICLGSVNDRNIINIFTTVDDNYQLNLADQINQCSIVTIEKDDGFPQEICEDCRNLLENAFKFQLLAQQSDQILRNGVDKKCIEDTFKESNPFLNYSKSGEHSNDTSDINFKVDEIFEVETIEILKKPTNLEKDTSTQQNIELAAADKPKRVYPVRNFQCDKCGVFCKTYTHLHSHKRSHHANGRVKCLHCPKILKSINIRNTHMIRIHTVDPVPCTVCGEIFKNPLRLQSHELTHNRSQYKCGQCPYSSYTKTNLERHESIHSDLYPYLCNICNVRLKSRYQLRNHVRINHERRDAYEVLMPPKINNNYFSPNKKFSFSCFFFFQCDKCDKKFNEQCKLKRHQVFHTGAKPYKCPVCPASQAPQYAYYIGVTKHIVRKHPSYNLKNLMTDSQMLKIYEDSIGKDK